MRQFRAVGWSWLLSAIALGCLGLAAGDPGVGDAAARRVWGGEPKPCNKNAVFNGGIGCTSPTCPHSDYSEGLQSCSARVDTVSCARCAGTYGEQTQDCTL